MRHFRLEYILLYLHRISVFTQNLGQTSYDKGLLEKILAELIKIANSPLETEQLALCDDVVSTD